MKIIQQDGHPVVLLHSKEKEIYDLFVLINDDPSVVPSLTEQARMALSPLPNPDPNFVGFLSAGSLALVDGVIATIPGRER